MSHAVPPPLPDPVAPSPACENCAAPLQGDYCHACGQSTHSPVRHVGHAIEEVFESFWHLDGRIFRTVRDLFVPGRIAERYLAGHRVRYVAPMRLFVILTLLTFFVAKFVIHDSMLGLDVGTPRAEAEARFAQADTAEAVAALRDSALDDLREARRVTGAIPGVTPQLDSAEHDIQTAARRRLDALGAPADPHVEGAVSDSEPAPATSRAPDPDAVAPVLPDTAASRAPPTIGGPIGERIERNIGRLSGDPDAYARALLGVAPTALFILVPLFAVMLKLLYLFQRRLYLEHVVVGLYSHAALMLGLLLVFCGALLTPWLATHSRWAVRIVGLVQSLLLCAMPVYLLLMQKRVYGQSWAWTLLKFAIIGQLYFALFLSVAIPMAGYALYAL